MWNWLKSLSSNDIFKGVVASLIAAFLFAAVAKRRMWLAKLRKPALRRTHAYSSDQSTTGARYPLKYYLEVVNDSRKCVAVRVLEYKPKAVALQKFVPQTLQLMLDSHWFPTPDSVESVALLPNQRCRAWIGVDTTNFTKAQLDRFEGNIGTLILTANSKEVAFDL
jgi:hypothetical protein